MLAELINTNWRVLPRKRVMFRSMFRRSESDPIDDRIETGARKRPGEFCCVFDIRRRRLHFAGHID
jgi:hypothetical protein